MKAPQLQKILLLTPFLLYPVQSLLAQASSPAPSAQDRAQSADPTKTDHGNKSESIQPDETDTSRFLRIKTGKGGEPAALQTSITRYERAKGDLLIDLVGAVHIGEAEYYRQLNQQFRQYDVVLYELVAPPGTRIPQGGRSQSNHPLAWLQGSMKNLLGLDSQLEKIDYQAPNFRHADLSPQQISQRMAERGDTPLTVGLSALADILRQQNLDGRQLSTTEPNSRDPQDWATWVDQLGHPSELKKLLARQFTESSDLSRQLGPTLNQLLIVDRNQAAIQVLRKSLQEGHQKIAIFYGAAHLPDFEERLMDQLDLERTASTWVTAWDLTRSPRRNQLSNPSSLIFQWMKWIDD